MTPATKSRLAILVVAVSCMTSAFLLGRSGGVSRLFSLLNFGKEEKPEVQDLSNLDATPPKTETAVATPPPAPMLDDDEDDPNYNETAPFVFNVEKFSKNPSLTPRALSSAPAADSSSSHGHRVEAFPGVFVNVYDAR